MDFGLKDRVALVCGSSQGIGAAIAGSLAAEGAKTILVARNEDKLKRLRDKLSGAGHEIMRVDLSDDQEVETLCRQLTERQVDIVINNAGGPPPGLVSEAAIADFEAAISLHLFASHRIMQAVLPGMKSRSFGRFINVISTSVKIPIPGLGVSNTTRGAMASWAKTLSNEVAAHGITVNNILPGAVDTDRLEAIFKGQAEKAGTTSEAARAKMIETIPARRIGEPKELGDLVAFLVSERAAYINGVSIPVDGGRTGSL